MRRFTLLILASIASPAALPAEDASGSERVHRSAEGFSAAVGERGSAETTILKEQRTQSGTTLSKPRSVALATVAGNSWIFDADAVLFDDFDGDGYYRFLSLRFDADTYLPDMYVYAMLYLSADGETWEHYFTTQDFLIGGTVPDDEYFVETELLEGYAPGLYDVLIELYDADFGTFEDDFGPAESSALSLLPIEDASFDAAAVQIAVSSEGGGGTIGIWMLPVLFAVGRAARRRRRPRGD